MKWIILLALAVILMRALKLRVGTGVMLSILGQASFCAAIAAMSIFLAIGALASFLHWTGDGVAIGLVLAILCLVMTGFVCMMASMIADEWKRATK